MLHHGHTNKYQDKRDLKIKSGLMNWLLSWAEDYWKLEGYSEKGNMDVGERYFSINV